MWTHNDDDGHLKKIKTYRILNGEVFFVVLFFFQCGMLTFSKN